MDGRDKERFGLLRQTEQESIVIKRLAIEMCTKFEEFILIHETMVVKQYHLYVPLELIWQGTKSSSHPAGLPG